MGADRAWFPFRSRTPKGPVRLFCFPHAGGGASAYRNWMRSLALEVEVCPIQYPGRESRISEPAYTDFRELIRALRFAVEPLTDKPYVFFGHSMGALIAFGLACDLRSAGAPMPEHLFVSACSAPQCEITGLQLQGLPDSELMGLLGSSGHIPAILLSDEEYMKLLLPLLRADIAVCASYRYQGEAPLDCPITSFAAVEDNQVPLETIPQWQALTVDSWDLEMIPGDHGYIASHTQPLLSKLSKRLEHIVNKCIK
jgi:medium-chain acyl-[acyl-carrier-protein] hydrolase